MGATPVPDAATWHGIRRFTAGYTPALRAQVEAAGGFDAWFEGQLDGSYDDAWFDRTAQWWVSINADDATVWQRDRSGVESLWWADASYQRWAMVRRLGSQRQVLEAMAELWEHHLHVPALGEVGPFRASYGKTIRRHALGRFADLLEAATTHPAMSVYLGNANSHKSAPNENLGRELLELHTVGIGQYDEADVKDSARLLTGFRVGVWTTWATSYDPAAHWTGPVQVMGFSHPNSDPDGRPALSAYLRYLATHPATARRVAHRLAVRFVSDTPSEVLVDDLAAVYLAHDTDLRAVLRALVASAEYRAATDTKVRTPAEDVIATYRALGAELTAAPAGHDDECAANALLWQAQGIGAMPFDWPRPDGRPDTALAWSSTSRFLASLDVHYTMSGGWWPSEGVRYRDPLAWLPTTPAAPAAAAAPPPAPSAAEELVAGRPKKDKKHKKKKKKKKRHPAPVPTPLPPAPPTPPVTPPPTPPPTPPEVPVTSIRFDALVDHLCRTMLGRPVEATMLQAAGEAVGCAPTDVITHDHPVVAWEMPRLLTVLLDSPLHLTR
ncbi:DUF1800 domain-containing protein [Nocardioides daeguensis]|uniref:DUF1800 domain-containing protein n=1 Tax=Nocardioides daeguensis TaxID=908359 RepID=A0ABP6WI17_9ACTN|nr:DUF1800 domain-containing protein [Nocardioides daeguensis]MBV6727900.1 DUF1800 domain-containing protein [Nocardioides daeguensis]MCR1771643.1 DUF1800 domain-containing protein [Nocardioides daeguensis]